MADQEQPGNPLNSTANGSSPGEEGGGMEVDDQEQLQPSTPSLAVRADVPVTPTVAAGQGSGAAVPVTPTVVTPTVAAGDGSGAAVPVTPTVAAGEGSGAAVPVTPTVAAGEGREAAEEDGSKTEDEAPPATPPG